MLIPQANVRNLMLRQDVVDALRDGRSHIYPITHIDQGLELLTGMRAGDVQTEGTVHNRISMRLHQLAQDIVPFSSNGREAAKPTIDPVPGSTETLS